MWGVEGADEESSEAERGEALGLEWGDVEGMGGGPSEGRRDSPVWAGGAETGMLRVGMGATDDEGANEEEARARGGDALAGGGFVVESTIFRALWVLTPIARW